MTALLELEDVEARYGPVHVLHGISLAVAEGSVVAVLGSERRGQDDDAPRGLGHGAALGLRSASPGARSSASAPTASRASGSRTCPRAAARSRS